MPNDLALPSLADLSNAAPNDRLSEPGDRPEGVVQALTRPQKAALIVRLLQSEGTPISLHRLPDDVQLALTQEMTGIRHVNHATIEAVAEEFLAEIEAIGLQFPNALDGALGIMGQSLTPSAAARLRQQAGVDFDGDPWETLRALDADRLHPVIERECVEIGAVILSKLKVPTAAAVLGKLPGSLARRLAYAVSQIGQVSPATVRRIGVSLARELDTRPVRAFDDEPVARVGAILNSSTAGTRDDVLEGLEETDRAFAEEVRKAIFTFENIPGRVAARDIPRVLREIDQQALVLAVAVAAGKDADAAEFILANISQRMADSIRAEAAEKGQVAAADGEAAMASIVAAIRRLEASGEVFLTVDADDETA